VESPSVLPLPFLSCAQLELLQLIVGNLFLPSAPFLGKSERGAHARHIVLIQKVKMLPPSPPTPPPPPPPSPESLNNSILSSRNLLLVEFPLLPAAPREKEFIAS
jgi:hypothetical protein